MKKIFSLIVLLAFALSVSAQRASSTTPVPITGLKNLTMLPVDSITQGATVYWTFDVNRQKPYYFAFAFAIDTITSSTNRLACTIWGSMNNVDWVSSGLTQVNLFPTAGGGADTTFQMVQVTTPVIWRYLKARFVSVDANVKGARFKAIGLKVGER